MKKQPSTPVTALRKEYNLGIEHRIMNSPQPKIYPMVIYEILKNCSNESHKLSLLDIRDLLAPYCTTENKESQLKNVKRNIYCVMQFDERVMATKKNGDNFDPDYDSEKDASQIEKMWYDQDFTTTDINIISNAIINSKNMGTDDRSQLLNKISRLNGISSSSRFNWTQNVITDAQGMSIMDTDLLYHNLEYIYEAIENQKCLGFTLCEYNRHKVLFDGQTVNAFVPYKIIEKDGIYLLIGLFNNRAKLQEKLYKKYDNTSKLFDLFYYPVHKLSHIHINEDAEYIPIEKSSGSDKSLKDYIDSINNPFIKVIDPSKQERMHYSERIDLQVHKDGLYVLIDYFGKKVIVDKVYDNEIKIENGEKTYIRQKSLYDLHLNKLSVHEQEQLLLLLLTGVGQNAIKLVSPQSFLEHYHRGLHHQLRKSETKISKAESIDAEVADTKAEASKPSRVRVTKVRVDNSTTKKKTSSKDSKENPQ